ncbi:helicase, SNF2/RAD54 family [Paenibacillus sp. JCM 10914]|nr:helicase, SNF2/RAD54 family [Paenibacillus sp. JCM 10914]
MNQPLYGVWLGDVFFCFSGEVSEPGWMHGAVWFEPFADPMEPALSLMLP